MIKKYILSNKFIIILPWKKSFIYDPYKWVDMSINDVNVLICQKGCLEVFKAF